MGKISTSDKLTAYGEGVEKTIKALGRKPYVKVGILSKDFDHPKAVEGNGRNAKPPQFGKLTTVGMVGIWAEFGTDTEPERSWLRSTVDERWKEWEKFSKELARKVLFLQMDTDKALGLIGAMIERDIKAKIRSNIQPANAPSTLAAKAPKTKTLINTGQFVNSIAWELLRKKD